MKKIFFLILNLVLLYTAQSQNISRKVIAAAGGSYKDSLYQVSYTVGETVISTLSNGDILLTQGFQQPEPCKIDFQLNNGLDTIRACGNLYQLTAPSTFQSYGWNSGDTINAINITTSGWYTCTVSNGVCEGTDSVFVSLVNANIANSDTSICRGQSVTLKTLSSTIIDIDGNIYPTVKIGNQLWLQKNLNVSKYRNGDVIPQITDPTEWANTSTGAWCWYNNDSITYGATYGKLYNWYAVNDPRGLSPHGSEVASNSNWIELLNFLGGFLIAGSKLKEVGNVLDGTGLWLSPNYGADNSSGFTGLPGGYRGADLTYGTVRYNGYWWSKTEYSNTNAFIVNLFYGNTQSTIYNYNKVDGFSVRCVLYNSSNILTNSYAWSNGETTPSINVSPNQTTTYYCTVSNGISSCIDSVTVRINQPTQSTETLIACDSLLWHGVVYRTSNNSATYTTTNAQGCDSVIHLNLTIIQPTTSSTDVSECVSYTWNGTTYTTSGSYVKHFTNAAGCDSAATLNLIIKQPTASSTNVAVCVSYTWNGTTYTTSGSYVKHFTNTAGCDSAATLNLTIKNTSSSTETLYACDSLLWHGTVYRTSNSTATYTTTNAQGCDSVVHLNLTISKPNIYINATAIKCHGDSSIITVTADGGISPYTGIGTFKRAVGSYDFTITDAKGCSRTQSIILTEPTLLTATTTVTTAYRDSSGTATAIAFGGTPAYSYKWNTIPVQTTATASGLAAGTYQVTITDANGCTVTAAATILSATITDCSTAFQTIGMGGWGAPANGNNPGVYLNNHFAAAYPTGLTIGDCNRFIKLTSATAVRNYLPSGGSPAQLNSGTLVNPTRTQCANTFAGQLIALNLNLRFDSIDANFGASSSLLKDAVISEGMFRGWTVQRLYNEANKIIGCGASKNYITQLNDAVEEINESWEEGHRDNEYVECPSRNDLNTPIASIDNLADQIRVYPNPTSSIITLSYTMLQPGNVTIILFDALGKKQFVTQQSHTQAGSYKYILSLKENHLSAGMYFMQINRNGILNNEKILLLGN